MQLESENEDSANTNKTPCAACSDPAVYKIWEIPVCTDCASDWNSRAPTYGDIADKYGPNADNVAVYQAFTQRWLEKRKASAA